MWMSARGSKLLGSLCALCLAACVTEIDQKLNPKLALPAPIDQHAQNTSDVIEHLTSVTWRLVDIQSMDDAIGTTKPKRPNLYTMALYADGTVQFRLNCNQASTTWAITQTTETRGQLEFAPAAMTRAICLPPSLDVKIARDLEFVRSYALKDDNLYLNLMADGDIYAWEPYVPKMLPAATGAP